METLGNAPAGRDAAARGNAMVITLMLLVILTAIGIFAVNISTREMSVALQTRVGAETRNMAEAGAYYAIGQLPTTFPTGTPYTTTLTVGPNQTATYSVTSDLSGPLSIEPGYGANYRFANFTVQSTAQAPTGFVGGARVDADVRFGPTPAGTGY